MRKVYKIAVIPGDGTGPEVIREGLKVLEAISKKYNFNYKIKEFPFGGERYIKTKKTLEESDIEELKKYDAIYLGAIGHPDIKPGILETGILLKLRFSFDQYINLRPIKLYNANFCPIKDKKPEDIDFVVIRENTEGLYKGMGEFRDKNTENEVAIQISYNTYKGIKRCIEYAFLYCRKRNKKKKVTLCGKTNVLTYAWDLWQRVFDEVKEKYPDISTDYVNVDAACMWFIKNPEWFDVVVTDNMFGDIITDLGAIIQGGLGIAAGGNINPSGISMFEPIGGSAPKYANKNVINPLAAICALGMLLENLGEEKASRSIENAVINVVNNKLKSLSAGKMGYSTQEVGDLVVESLT